MPHILTNPDPHKTISDMIPSTRHSLMTKTFHKSLIPILSDDPISTSRIHTHFRYLSDFLLMKNLFKKRIKILYTNIFYILYFFFFSLPLILRILPLCFILFLLHICYPLQNPLHPPSDHLQPLLHPHQAFRHRSFP